MGQESSHTPLLIKDDDKTSQELENFGHDDSRGGHEHVSWPCSYVAHHQDEDGILQHQRYQTEVLQM